MAGKKTFAYNGVWTVICRLLNMLQIWLKPAPVTTVKATFEPNIPPIKVTATNPAALIIVAV